MSPHELVRTVYYIIAGFGLLLSALMGLLWHHFRLAERVTKVESAMPNHSGATITERMRGVEERLAALEDRVSREFQALERHVEGQGAALGRQAVDIAALAGRLEGAANSILAAIRKGGDV